MSENSNIGWTDHTFNPWIGCTKVSPGCAHCYAETLNKRTRSGRNWGKGKPRERTTESYWRQALKWNQFVVYECGSCGQRHFVERGKDIDGWECLCSTGGTICRGPRPPRVFPSLCDWLDDEVQIEWLADFLELIRRTPNLDWLLLTKRPENWQGRMAAALDYTIDLNEAGPAGRLQTEEWLRGWMKWDERKLIPPNVWLGVSVEDQKRADERIPRLLETPAAIRFLSCEPLLGPIGLIGPYEGPFAFPLGTGIHWVIIGGESGPNFREMDLGAALAIGEQCVDHEVPFFMKQDSGMYPGRQGRIPDEWWVHQFPQLSTRNYQLLTAGGTPAATGEQEQDQEQEQEVQAR